jgi:magnesium chelatase subunit D
MKLALLLNAVDPAIGGVLIRGEKGTAKSTAARALAQLLPEIAVHPGCLFACDPDRPHEWCPLCRSNEAPGRSLSFRRARLVTLPLNATEDMVAGGLDFSATMAKGARAFQPGLLAKAHRGILYIDEANLLDDHLVDIILDAAESGENIVEREGLSLCHSSRFALIASMNPEEGGLRPQLLDRFGLCVEVGSESDPALRVELIERREAFELDPRGFCRARSDSESALSARVARARELLPAVGIEPYLRKYIGELALSRHVAGHRADIVMARAAIAHAAFAGRTRVEVRDILAVAELALLHRSRDAMSPPLPPPPPENGDNDDNPAPDRNEDRSAQAEESPKNEERSSPRSASEAGPEREGGEGDARSVSENDRLFDVGETFRVKRLAPLEDRLPRRGSGRRSRSRTEDKQGRYVRSMQKTPCRDIALDATLRAAAPYQLSRRMASGRKGVVIYRRDWREKVREKKVGTFILFVVDGSGSMGARGRMAAAKGAVMSLLLDAYQKRDRIAMITFRRAEASLLLPPTASVDVAGRLLRELPVGGRTPLSAALVKAYETLVTQLRRDPSLRPLVVLVTDGKANVSLASGVPAAEEAIGMAGRIGRDKRIRWIVVDTEEQKRVRFGLAPSLALALEGECCRIDDLRAADLLRIAKGM